ncbi:MAG: iron-sulfur cluster insertion protein ErpA [Alphaproteobacteria bacterium]
MTTQTQANAGETAAGPALTITDRAAAQIAKIVARDGNGAMHLRIAVSGGGCSGFQYGFSLDDCINADDRTFTRNGVTVVVDEISLDLLAGAEVDYVTEMIGSSFRIQNPNAASSCGCGSSFAI